MSTDSEKVPVQGLPPIDAPKSDPDADVGEGEEMQEPNKAEAYLRGVAKGEIPFSAVKGRHNVKLGDYAFAIANHLAHTLGQERKKVITLALCHYARSLTSAPIVSQHDVAMLTQGMQLVVQDLAHEVGEFTQLALSVAEQEETAGKIDN